MKICFLTYSVFNLGGVQRVISVLASALSKEYEVEIVCLESSYEIDRTIYNLDQRVSVDFIENVFERKLSTKIRSKIVREINENTKLVKKKISTDILTQAYYPQEVQKKIIKYLNLKEYDVIIASEGPLSLLLAIINDKINCTAIGWQHSSYNAYFETENKYCWKQERLFEEYVNRLDKYIVLTEDDKMKMKTNLNITSERIYNPVSFTSIDNSTGENKTIITVGRLDKYTKGLDLLIEAFSKIETKHNEWKLEIVGEGPDKAEISNLINNLNLDDKIIVSPFTNNIQEKYLESSIFVSSSRWEGFGLAIIEAMECGLPVVAFDNSGPREIINKNDINGKLVPSGNIDLLSIALSDLIQDDQKRFEMAKESKKRAKDFSLEKIICEWKKIIKNN